MPTRIWPPPATSADVRLPTLALEDHGGKQVLKIAGTAPAAAANVDGKFVGGAGFVDTAAAAAKLNGDNGQSGWTPVLSPEQDGTRSLLKVSDWSNGTGTKPTSGMYLAAGGYVMDKASAFNFNVAKRLETFAAVTSTGGEVTIAFSPAYASPPRVLATARGSTSGRPVVAEVISVSAAQCVIRATQGKATLASLLTTLFDTLSGVQINAIVVEA